MVASLDENFLSSSSCLQIGSGEHNLVMNVKFYHSAALACLKFVDSACLIIMNGERNHSMGVRWTGLPHSSKTDSDRLIKDNRRRHLSFFAHIES